MDERVNNTRKLKLKLLEEKLWEIKDKINVIIESIADHEADLIRMKNSNEQVLKRLSTLEAENKKRRAK